eukprot:TRINITY_DN30033_c0_g1_i1.p1 TRINITY_DN30033_c0_g1~~TRINITY_DN30033_c0_g1_i1.p1  ORF type:complete len:493 (+),score=56.00 TRINITY_DN30033_c0_g1_i1:52-1479(+)
MGSHYCPPINYGMVEDDLHRSGQPNQLNFPFLERLGLNTVIYLAADEPTQPFLNFCDDQEINFIHLGMDGPRNPWKPISEETVLAALEIILNPQNHPLHVMCNLGRHRTGTLIGCLRKLQRWNLTSILEEYRRYAGSKVRLMNEQFIELFDTDLVRIPVDQPKWLLYAQGTPKTTSFHLQMTIDPPSFPFPSMAFEKQQDSTSLVAPSAPGVEHLQPGYVYGENPPAPYAGAPVYYPPPEGSYIPQQPTYVYQEYPDHAAIMLRARRRRRRYWIIGAVVAAIAIAIVVALVVKASHDNTNDDDACRKTSEDCLTSQDMCPDDAHLNLCAGKCDLGCCSWYESSTCCLPSACGRREDYGALLENKGQWCRDGLDMLNCAICSPLAGRFVLPSSEKNITVCTSFCSDVYSDCTGAYSVRMKQRVSEIGSARDFCEQALGLTVDIHDCFDAAAVANPVGMWLVMGTVLLVFLLPVWFH